MIGGSVDDELVGDRVEPGRRTNKAVLRFFDAGAAVNRAQGYGDGAGVPASRSFVGHRRLGGVDLDRASTGAAGVAGDVESAVFVVIGAVVEDLKVSTDDVQERVEAFEDDVQSVDIQSFNKL